MILVNMPVLTANVPNLNGHIYAFETLQDIFETYYGEEIPGRIGMPNISMPITDMSLDINLNDLAFKSMLTSIKNGQLLANIEILNTPKGIIFKDALLSGNIKENSFRTAGFATVGKYALDMSTVEITDLKLCQINYVENPA